MHLEFPSCQDTAIIGSMRMLHAASPVFVISEESRDTSSLQDRNRSLAVPCCTNSPQNCLHSRMPSGPA